MYNNDKKPTFPNQGNYPKNQSQNQGNKSEAFKQNLPKNEPFKQNLPKAELPRDSNFSGYKK